jgi:hypothetical protein
VLAAGMTRGVVGLAHGRTMRKYKGWRTARCYRVLLINWKRKIKRLLENAMLSFEVWREQMDVSLRTKVFFFF